MRAPIIFEVPPAWRAQPRTCLAASTLAAAALAVTGCGGGDPERAAPTGATLDSTPALARTPAARGEYLFRGEASPAAHGPLELAGRYRVRFEQFAPEDPRLDFAGQTPFTAALQRRAGDTRGQVELFGAARRTGRRELTLSGRYTLDVSFGDFPYAVRFTPVR